ncbi:class I lanthipeptide [Flavobacterium pectinovorum]|uniref:RSAM-modified peptide n=1 Tax=Flavobacterium pectinovorum TaxID=29533 RepID=A0A502ESF3_9FLAO|nr:class I lanthipeptide [Flavobacterium pectinovorum]TPG40748.1 rSAM-modified peptide [Flavobacterium pectinovorum]
MKKLQLNKKTVSVLNKKEMSTVKGGQQAEFLSVYSCRASRSGNDCCGSSVPGIL